MYRFPLIMLLVFGLSKAQPPALYQLPSDVVTINGNAITISTGISSLSYIEGIGWSHDSDAELIRLDAELFTPIEIFESLSLNTARIEGIRFSGKNSIRIVVDIRDNARLELEQSGYLEDGEELILGLPELLVPSELPDAYRGIQLNLKNGKRPRLSLSGPPMTYRVFSLVNPNRLVIDLVPLSEATIIPETRLLEHGVLYRRFAFNTGMGRSGVHLIEIPPNKGKFRVVGQSKVARPLSELARGAYAAINAGYFDTRSFEAIGLLQVDYGLLSFPSRNRASIGIDDANNITIDRTQANVKVRISDRLYQANTPAISIHTLSNAWVGNPALGVLRVKDGQVIDNKIGPRTVPENGFAIVYSPEQRDLAIIENGEKAALELDFEPAGFAAMRYAVEAGPLLVKNGQAAFLPEQEAFARGRQIIDAYTQQAAIGVKRDGTMLFVTADNMVAEDLVPLMLSLGAIDAMRLDSGNSSTLFANGQVINRKVERNIVSAFVFIPNER